MNKYSQYLISSLAFCCVSNTQALEPLKESREQYIQESSQLLMTQMDKNGDGKIQKEEIKKKRSKLMQLDEDGDGAVDLKELEKQSKKYIESKGEKMLDVLYKKTSTQNLYLDFYFPDVDNGKEKPVVIYTHGGGWATGSRHGAAHASFDVVHKKLLEQGFCVAAVTYRLWEKSGDTMMRDCVIDSKDAIRFLSAHSEELGIDPSSIYTFGDSAGGHISQMLLLSPSDSLLGDPDLAEYPYKTAAGVSWYGPCDFQDEQLFNHNDRENFRDRFGPRILGKNADPKDKVRLYAEMSPITYLTKDSPPLLMIQGDKDTTIPVKQAVRMEKELETVKAPVEILIVKNAGHNWRKVDADISPSRHEIIDRTVQFLVDHAK